MMRALSLIIVRREEQNGALKLRDCSRWRSLQFADGDDEDDGDGFPRFSFSSINSIKKKIKINCLLEKISALTASITIYFILVF